MKFDEIGPWSEIKLDILRDYAAPYSLILQKNGFRHGYIDAFSGPGLHVRKADKIEVQGSPIVALGVHPPFDEYHFIDLDGEKVEHLKSLVGERCDTTFYNDDCNRVLATKVLPRFSWESRRRVLCVLDPYKLTLDWKVLVAAGTSNSVEVFVNFPVMHMNRNCKKPSIADLAPGERAAMDRFWGDSSWHGAMFKPNGQLDMFAGEELGKQENEDLVEAYCERLRTVAGFKFVAKPLAMRNSTKAVVYYLIFAGPNKTGWSIVSQIFNKHRS